MVVAALAVTETITWGIVYYGFPVYLGAMEADLGASRVAVTGALSLGLGVSALAAIPVGRWLDRRGPRLLMTLGSALAAALLAAWARIESVAALYAVWALMGVAMAATLYEPAFAAIVQWFDERRDRALLVLTLAAGLASTVFMPLEAWLLSRLGWRRSVEMLAALLAATTIPIHALVLRAPAALGAPAGSNHGFAARVPVGGYRGERRSLPPISTDVSLRDALRQLVFWVLAGAFLLGNFATAALTVHLIPYLGRHGHGPAGAAAVVGWTGAMQLGGRVLFVPFASRLGARAMTGVVFLLQAAGVLNFALLAWWPHLAPAVLLVGAANGMLTLARATLVSDIFGRGHYGSISGAMALAGNGARALGPIGASLLYGALGSYEALFAVIAGVLVVAGVSVLAIGAGGVRAPAPAA